MSTKQKENGIALSRDDVISSMKTTNDDTKISKHNRIMIVDDEVDILAVYQKGLNRNGFGVDRFSNPEKALSGFKPDAYDLIISDIRMPKMNGFELCREIRKKDEKVKIYFMTAFEINLAEFEKVLPSIKVDGFIKKPLRIADLCSLVQSVMNNGNEKDGR